MTPIRVIPFSVEYLDPLKKISCVITAPTFPPPPVIPDITPSDLYNNYRSGLLMKARTGTFYCIILDVKVYGGCHTGKQAINFLRTLVSSYISLFCDCLQRHMKYSTTELFDDYSCFV